MLMSTHFLRACTWPPKGKYMVTEAVPILSGVAVKQLKLCKFVKIHGAVYLKQATLPYVTHSSIKIALKKSEPPQEG